MKPFRYAAILIALTLSLVAPSLWRASTLNPAAANASFQQGQRFSLRLLRIEGSGRVSTGVAACDVNLPPVNTTQSQVSVPLPYSCSHPDRQDRFNGQVQLQVPATITGTRNNNGNIAPDAPAVPNFSVAGAYNAPANTSHDPRLLATIDIDQRAVCMQEQRRTVAAGGSTQLGITLNQCDLREIRSNGGAIYIVDFFTSIAIFANPQATIAGPFSNYSFRVYYEATAITTSGTIALNPTTLGFNTTLGSNPATQTVTLSNTGGGAMNWQATATTSSGGNWLTVTPASGSLNAGQSTTLTVAVNASALAAGTYNGTLTVSSANASNSPRTVPVTLTVTGCAATLGQTATAPEQAQDTLTLTKVMPADGDVVSGANLKRGGLKATVTWLLQSSDAGVIDVTLYDQEGNIRYDGGTIPVRKTCPPKESAQDIVLDLSRLDLTPKNGIAVTGLKLTAKLMDSLVILKRADVNYGLLPDAIAFEGTPTINGQSAPDGSNLPANGMVNFNCALRYLLANDVTGRLRVQALNESGGVLASKDLGMVAPTAQAALWTTPLDFQFTVPADVSQARVVAALLASNGTVLKTSTPLTYGGPEVRIQFGYYKDLGEPQSFAPINETRVYGSSIRLSNHPDPRFRRPVIRAEYKNVRDPANKFLRLKRTGFEGQTATSRLGGIRFGEDIPQTPTQTDGFVDFCLSFRCDDTKPDFDNVDRMDFRVELRNQTDGSLVTTSTAVTIYFHRVNIARDESPSSNTQLPPGQSREFAVTLNYNLIRPGTNIYAVLVKDDNDLPNQENSYRAQVEPIPLRTNLSAGVSGEARFTFTATVPKRTPPLSLRSAST